MDKTLFPDIGRVRLPEAIIEYVEKNEYRISVEQEAYQAEYAYAQGVGTKVKIKRFCEYCPACGWHSIDNPNQKRQVWERRHKIVREYETIFSWDNYGANVESLAEHFEKWRNSNGRAATALTKTMGT